MKDSREFEVDYICSTTKATLRYIESMERIICNSESTDDSFNSAVRFLQDINNYTLNLGLESYISLKDIKDIKDGQ